MRFLAVLLCWSGVVLAQNPPPKDESAEMTTHDTPATFRTKVNLVLVPVVVRDRQGQVVGNLTKDDFQLFDRGKPQTISSFSVETLESQGPAEPPPPDNGLEGHKTNPADIPKRFVAYFFDDIHISQEDLMRVRAATERHIDESLVATDRAAIFTTSGRVVLDFTDDRAKLKETLLKLRAAPVARPSTALCPDVTYYQADLIQNKNDTTALQAAVQDAVACLNLDPANPATPRQAQAAALTAVNQMISSGEAETRMTLNVFRDVVRRTSTAPGQRSVVFISPGFLTLAEVQQEVSDIIDRAIRGNVIVSAVNARGLYTIIAGGDASDGSRRSLVSAPIKAGYDSTSAAMEEDTLAAFSWGTGGMFFHNNNDLFEGINRVASRPEFIYVLGFSPENLKLDGRFHALKITVKKTVKVEVQARRGYYAPQHLASPEETAKQEINDALFSREELRDIPLELHTQFFKASTEEAKLAVMARVDVRRLQFRKENGRNSDNLVMVSGVFDRNGNLVTGSQKTIEMHLKDQTLESRLDRGITVKNSFDVKPGSYLIRLVIRDSEGKLMAAANGTVDIPMN